MSNAFARAVQLLQQGNLAEADACCRSAAALGPLSADFLALHGVVLSGLERHDESITMLRRAQKLGPFDARIQFNLALALQRAGHEQDALTNYLSAGRGGRHLPALVNAGNLYLRRDQPDCAERTFREVLVCEPANLAAIEGLGVSLLQQRRLEEARKLLAPAASRIKVAPTLHANFGAILHLLGDYDAAEAQYRIAISLAPNHAPFRDNLATLCYDRRDFVSALAENDSTLKLRPGDTRALALRALIFEEMGQSEQARALTNLEGLIAQTDMEVPPPGYESTLSFYRSLSTAIKSHPTLVTNRPNKTTRNGSQTGELFDVNDPALLTLRAHIVIGVEKYVSERATSIHQPFLKARPSHWTLRTWATVLKSGGFQDPHFHPAGWLSGVYYVQIPDEISCRGVNGFIEFGRPDPRYAPKADPRTMLFRPQPGRMLLFPSYFWHHTLPFESSVERISIAFDVIPSDR